MADIRSQLGPRFQVLIDTLRNDDEVVDALQEISIINAATEIQDAYGVSFTPQGREKFREIFQKRF